MPSHTEEVFKLVQWQGPVTCNIIWNIFKKVNFLKFQI